MSDDIPPNNTNTSGRKLAAEISSTLRQHKPTQQASKADRAQWTLRNTEVYTVLYQALDEVEAEHRRRYHNDETVSDPELNQQILAALDKAIDTGHWEGGLLFDMAGKDLRRLRETLGEQFQLTVLTAEKSSGASAEVTVAAGEVSVYVALYLANGDKLPEWERVLGLLSTKSIGRPIYQNENDVRAFIASRPMRTKDAYVVVHVKEGDIIKPRDRDYYNKDRTGRPLLLVKEEAIKINNIVKFVHNTGTYHYDNGRLVKQDD